MKLLWKEKKKECDTEQQGACLKTQFKPPTVVRFSCAGRGNSPTDFPCESKQQKGHDRTAGLISVPRARQKQISWLGTHLLDRSKSSYPDFPAGQTSSRPAQAGCAAAAEHLEEIRMSNCTSDFPSCHQPLWGDGAPKGQVLAEGRKRRSFSGPRDNETKAHKLRSPQGCLDVWWSSSVSCTIP